MWERNYIIWMGLADSLRFWLGLKVFNWIKILGVSGRPSCDHVLWFLTPPLDQGCEHWHFQEWFKLEYWCFHIRAERTWCGTWGTFAVPTTVLLRFLCGLHLGGRTAVTVTFVAVDKVWARFRRHASLRSHLSASDFLLQGSLCNWSIGRKISIGLKACYSWRSSGDPKMVEI